MLIKSIETLKGFLPNPNAGVAWESIAGSLRSAELKYLVPVIGADLYQLISEAYEVNALSTEETALLPYLQEPVAHLAMYLYSFQADVSLSDVGVQRVETTTNKTAYKYQLLALRDSFLDAGYEAIERLLVYLEKNASLFSAWQDSDARTAANELLIRSGRELRQYYTTLRQPERTYASMISIIRAVEDLSFTKLLGDQYAELKAHDVANDATLLERTVLTTLKKALAHLALGKAIVQIDVRLDDTGATQVGSGRVDMNRGEDSNRAGASGVDKLALSRQCEDIGLNYLDTAVRYLNTNASPTVFATWYGKLQDEALASPKPSNVNSTLNGAFGL